MRASCRASPGATVPAGRDARGEETQLLGWSCTNRMPRTVCMPGTHSKWVASTTAAVRAFETVMTGELFAVLSQTSILRHSIAGASPAAIPIRRRFAPDLRMPLGSANPPSAGCSRSAPAASCSAGTGVEAADRLSGLLIGQRDRRVMDRVSARRLGAAGRQRTPRASLSAASARPVSAPRSSTRDDAVRAGLVHAARRFWPPEPSE